MYGVIPEHGAGTPAYGSALDVTNAAAMALFLGDGHGGAGYGGVSCGLGQLSRSSSFRSSFRRGKKEPIWIQSEYLLK